MDEERLTRIEAKLDEVLAFRDQLLQIAAGTKWGRVLLGKVRT